MCHSRAGIYYVDDPPDVKIHLSQNTPTTWTVRALHPSVYGGYDAGDVICTGAVTGTNPLSITAPVGGWKCGVYRIYLTGASTDPNWGPAYGTVNFTVIREHSNFPRMPVSAFSVFNWKPNGFGRTDAEVDAGGGPQFAGPPDMIQRAALGMGMGRLSQRGSVTNVNLPTKVYDPNGGPTDRLVDNQRYVSTVLQDWWLNPTNPQWLDPVRERLAFIPFGAYGMGFDFFTISPSGSNQGLGHIFPKDSTIDGSVCFVEVVDGTNASTKKINIYYPNTSTLVESFDNITNDMRNLGSSINDVSAYVRAADGQSDGIPANNAPTAIGRTSRDGIAQVVSGLGPYGVLRIEGPVNEPDMRVPLVWEWIRNFSNNIRAAGGLVMGPCTVVITDAVNALTNGYAPFFAGGGGDYLDEISFHDYNTCLLGDANQGRHNIEAFKAVLKQYGQDHKRLWQTEANSYSAGNGTIMHARQARAPIMHTLLWEQYGVPHERNSIWYDVANGFWSVPDWCWGGDQSSQPHVALWCTMAQEVFGKVFHHRVDFGSVVANAMFLGSLYGDPLTGSVMALCALSAMENSTVTLQITGTSSALTVVDALGNQSTVTPNGSGRVTVDVPEIPTYLRLPAGVTATVYSVKDHGHNPNPSISSTAISSKLDGSIDPRLIDGKFMGVYRGSTTTTDGVVWSTHVPPNTLELMFGQDYDVERMIVWSGPAYQTMTVPLAYTIDTWDGASWTTQVTVDKTANATSFQWGDSQYGQGTSRETFWDEQWIEDQSFTPVTCSGIRMVATATSYGGQPDANSANLAAGYGAATFDLGPWTVQNVAVISSTVFSAPGAYATEVLADSPNGYWRLGEASGTTAASQVNSGTMNGAYQAEVTLGQPGLVSGTDTSVALASGSMHDAYINIPNTSLLNMGDTFSLECWVSAASMTGTKNVIKKAGDYILQATPSGPKLLFNTSTIATSTATLQSGPAYHIVATKSGSTVHIYVNGADVTETVANVTVTNNSNALTIGDNAAGLGITVDEVAIYPTALSADRVLAHYVAGTAPASPTNVSAPFIEGA